VIGFTDERGGFYNEDQTEAPRSLSAGRGLH
jgi:hypothetical protein